MTSRSTRVGFGLAIAVVLAVVWALSRFGATSTENARSQKVSEAAASAPDIRSAPPHGVTLHGTLTDSRGGPLRLDDLLIRVDGEEEPSPPGQAWLGTKSGRSFSTRIDQQGRYAFVDLRPGQYTLAAEFPFYQLGRGEIVLAATDVDRQLDLALDPCTVLHVRVEVALDEPLTDPRQFQALVHDNDSRGPVSVIVTENGAEAENGSETDHGLVGRVMTKEGHAGLKTWRLRQSIALKSELPVVVSVAVGNRVLQAEHVYSTDEDVVFALTLDQLRSTLGGVSLCVVDDEGRRPETPCAVVLTRSSNADADSWPYHELDRMVEPASTSIPNSGVDFDPAFVQGSKPISNPGEIRLRGLHPGPIGIQVSAPGFATLQLETVVESLVDRDLGQFRLDRCLEVRGHVRNPDGTPADADVEYVAVRDAVDGASIFPPEVRVTDSLGHFAIYDAGPGRFRLRAVSHVDPTLASVPRILSAPAGKPLDGIVIQLVKRTPVTATLEKPPTSDVTMRIVDASGLLVEEQSAGRTKRGAYTGFSLVPGEYTAHALANGREVANLSFTVREDPLRLTLSPR